MKQFIISLALIVSVFAITGCSSTSIAQNGNFIVGPTGQPAMGQITYTNYGFYLWNCVPMFSGSVLNPGGFALFTNTVTPELAVKAMGFQAKNNGATRIANVTTEFDSSYNWYTVFFWTRTVHASATMLE